MKIRAHMHVKYDLTNILFYCKYGVPINKLNIILLLIFLLNIEYTIEFSNIYDIFGVSNSAILSITNVLAKFRCILSDAVSSLWNMYNTLHVSGKTEIFLYDTSWTSRRFGGDSVSQVEAFAARFAGFSRGHAFLSMLSYVACFVIFFFLFYVFMFLLLFRFFVCLCQNLFTFTKLMAAHCNDKMKINVSMTATIKFLIQQDAD